VKSSRGRQKKRAGISLEVLVEEESAAKALQPVLARLLADRDVRVGIRQFRGKPDLLKKLPSRLAGYAAGQQRGEDIRVVVLVDKDSDDCAQLKQRLDAAGSAAGLVCRSHRAGDGDFSLLNRVAVRELESWYFGDWAAVRKAFPKVKCVAPAKYRGNPDTAHGKCSEAFESVLETQGVRLASKPEWGRRIGPHLSLSDNLSPSFRAFVEGVRDITSF
jgi:hypothetical protein